MKFSDHFIAASRDFCTFERHVPAPCLRRTFELKSQPARAEITVCGMGFYRVWINGREITKGFLAPYLYSPRDFRYYDCYDLSGLLRPGKNAVAFLLGNGFLNSMDNNLWDFQKAEWRSAPMLAAALEADGELLFEADSAFRTADSPITYDDYRSGEHYDARLELPGWTEPDFDDSNWRQAFSVPTPKGAPRLCTAEPIVTEKVLPPVSVTERNGLYLYDFGEVNAGVCTLNIRGRAGQRIVLRHGEIVRGGKLDLSNISFGDRSRAGYIQQDEYLCSGRGLETYTPSFTYHGFRYVEVEGLEPGQAGPELLRFQVLHSALERCGEFACGDAVLSRLQDCTLRSDLSNFYYYPTDCPQREKNGWTGDAALSAEQLLYNFDAAASLSEWLVQIRAAQNGEGALPGIVPTAGWGFAWGNGPAWDAVLPELVYQIHRFTGELAVCRDSAGSLSRYLDYMAARVNERGLLEYGLGDWCEADTRSEELFSTPLEVTDTLIGMDICCKSAHIFDLIGRADAARSARELRARLKASFRREWLNGCLVRCRTQTAQAMALYYGAFEPEERQEAYGALRNLILTDPNGMRVGILGGRVLFEVLSEFGDGSLAYRLIAKPDFPSYAYHLRWGATTLWEGFHRLNEGELTRADGVPRMLSLNHHFWGFLSGWLYRRVAGLQVEDCKSVRIAPDLFEEIGSAAASHRFPHGEISVSWQRVGNEVRLRVRTENISAQIVCPKGWSFPGGGTQERLTAGRREYLLIRSRQESR